MNCMLLRTCYLIEIRLAFDNVKTNKYTEDGSLTFIVLIYMYTPLKLHIYISTDNRRILFIDT